MTKYLIFALIVLTQSLLAQNATILRIDPDNARGGTAAEIFDSIRFIPLETTKASLFGKIDQLEVTDSLFIILDIQSRSILLFKRNGKFYNRINTGGVDKYLYYFRLDTAAREIIASNNFANGFLVYDYKGTFLRKEPCVDYTYNFYRFPNKNVLYQNRRSVKSESTDKVLYDLAYSDGYNHVIKQMKPYNARNESGDFNGDYTSFNFSGQPGSCMFSVPYEYKVYQMNDTGILHTYQFVFPTTYSLPHNFSSDSTYRNIRDKYAYGMSINYRKFSALERVYRWGEYLLFAAVSFETSVNSHRTFAYNLNNGSLISFSRVTGDSSSYYFPVIGSLLEQIDAVYRGEIFSSMAAYTFFALRNAGENKVVYPEALQKFVNENNKGANPAIVQFRLKHQL